MVRNGKVRWPEQTRCVRTASSQGGTRGKRAAGRSCEPSHLALFALVTVDEVSLGYLSAGPRYATSCCKRRSAMPRESACHARPHEVLWNESKATTRRGDSPLPYGQKTHAASCV